MTVEFYNKLTDDERLQYIYERENEVEAYQNLHYAESELIVTLRTELENMKEFNNAKKRVDNALERCMSYQNNLMSKYYPESCTPICESK